MEIEHAIMNLKAMKLNYNPKDIKSAPIVTCNIAIAALIKQIPKEATTYGITNSGDWSIRCPECDTSMEGTRKVARYCCQCGQALKWGD